MLLDNVLSTDDELYVLHKIVSVMLKCKTSTQKQTKTTKKEEQTFAQIEP